MATLAIAVAGAPAFLNNSTMAIPAGIYALLMYFTSAIFGWWNGKSQYISRFVFNCHS